MCSPGLRALTVARIGLVVKDLESQVTSLYPKVAPLLRQSSPKLQATGVPGRHPEPNYRGAPECEWRPSDILEPPHPFATLATSLGTVGPQELLISRSRTPTIAITSFTSNAIGNDI